MKLTAKERKELKATIDDAKNDNESLKVLLDAIKDVKLNVESFDIAFPTAEHIFARLGLPSVLVYALKQAIANVDNTITQAEHRLALATPVKKVKKKVNTP